MVFLFTSCTKGDNILVETVDLTSALEAKSESIPLSILCDTIEYVFLETSENCLIDVIDKILIDDSLIFIYNKKQLFVFNTDGKFVRKIGRLGKGPGEYLRIMDFTLDTTKDRISIIDSDQTKVIEYNYLGDLELEFKIESWPFRISNFYDESLILAWVKPNYLLNNGFSFSRYLWNGRNIGNSFNRKNEHANISEPATLLSRLNYYCDTLTYWEIFLDEIYRVNKKGEPISRYRITYKGKHIDEKPGEVEKGYFRYSYFIETKKYLYFLRGVYDGEIVHILYDKTSGGFLKPQFAHPDKNLVLRTGFENDIDGGFPFLPFDALRDGRLYCTFYPFELRNLIEQGILNQIKVKDKLGKSYLYSKVLDSKTMDNPVIMIVTCNE